MSFLSNRTESNSNSSVDGPDNDAEELTGWETPIDDGYFPEAESVNKKIIALADNKISLIATINKCKISLENHYNPKGWSLRASCPFPDHADRTPSFHVNPHKNIFHCFGCSRGGRAVRFLSLLYQKPQEKIAREILGNSINIDDLIQEIEEEEDAKIEETLMEAANMLRKFVLLNAEEPKAIPYAENISWMLDIYIKKNAFRGLTLPGLKARIDKMKQKLENFGDAE